METKDNRIVLMETIEQDPEAKALFDQAVEKIAPGAVAAAVEGDRINRVVAEKLAKLDETQKKLDAQTRTLEIHGAVNAERRKLLSSPLAQEHGLTLADLPAIETLMKEQEIGNHLSAAQFYVNARIIGSPRGDPTEGQIAFPRGDMNAFFKGEGEGRSITDGPNPRDMGKQWALDRAHKDWRAIKNKQRLDPSPYDDELDARGYLVGGAR